MLRHFIFPIASNKLRMKIARSWGVQIGSDCILHNVKFGSEPYLISIGNHCEITSGVQFITHDGATWVLRKDRQFLGSKFGPIIIHDNCFIGLNSLILPDVEIGPNSVVGAGSVVTKNIPENSIYAGNPARYICDYDEYLRKCKFENPGDTGLNDHRASVQKNEIIDMFKHRFK